MAVKDMKTDSRLFSMHVVKTHDRCLPPNE